MAGQWHIDNIFLSAAAVSYTHLDVYKRQVECTNDPMVRAKYQVKAALMHIVETEQLDPEKGMIEWEGIR